MLRVVLSIAVLSFLTIPIHAAAPSERAASAMVTLNSSFIAAHRVASGIDLASGGPIVLLRSGRLVLIRDGKETTVKVIPPAYHTYKTFAHIPPTIYLMLGPPGVGKLDDARLGKLRAYRKKMNFVAGAIGAIGLEDAALARQKKILGMSKAFLDKVIEAKEVSADALYAYTHGTTAMIKANLAGAAKAQIDGMHRQMMIWKKEMTAGEWRRLRVAIKGAVLARDDNLAKQYFQKLLGLKGEGARLVYMELYFPPNPMQRLLATRAVDRSLAIAIFGEPDRMFRDALADAATAYLKTMKFD